MIWILLPLLMSANPGLSAQSPIIQGFRAQQVGADVQLNWFIPKGLSCIDMQVQRSQDSLNFQTLSTVFGICGSDNSDSPYDYTDSEHQPGAHRYWYRIYASNGTVVSEWISLPYRSFVPGVLLLPSNPLIGDGMASFTHLSAEPLMLRWLNSTGQVLEELEPSASGQFLLQRKGRESGLYFLQVLNTEGMVLDVQRLILP